MILESAPFDVSFGGYVNGMSIDERGELFIYTSMGVTQSYGIIEKVYVSAEGELVALLEDGTVFSFGALTSIAGAACVHEYGSFVSVLAPSCTSVGYNIAVCEICGDEEYEFLPATGHVYGDPVVVKEPNGREDGVLLSACTVCGTPKMETLAGFSEGLAYEKTPEDTYRVIGIGTCTDTEIIVPEEHLDRPVTEIGEKAFYDCDTITSVRLPETITKIYDKAFANCDNLTNISMPENVTVGVDVFRGSIHVEIVIRHILQYVEYKEATCTEPGNIAFWWCPICDMYYRDEKGTERLYDVIIPNAHNFVDGVCTKCGMVLDSVLIVAIDEIAHLGEFPLGTLENAIGLPDYVNVWTADGVKHTLPVKWDLSNYDKSVAGTYTLTGVIQSGEFHYAPGLTNTVTTTVTSTDKMIGTADIVFILDISGSMEDEINHVKNNIRAFAQAIADLGVSVRWSAVTYSDFTVSGPREETQFVMNGANTWFTNVEDYKNAIGAIILANGGDGPETAIDGLMFAYQNLDARSDARTFYVLLTDADYKINNHYGVGSIDAAASILAENSINVSVITDSWSSDDYRALYNTTDGIYANIYSDFSEDLLETLVPIIYGEVVE